MALNVLFSNIYYSKHDTRTPMIFAAIGVIINIVLNLALVGPFQHSGLAFATSVAAVANSAMFLLGIKKKHNDIRVIESVKKLALIVLMAVIAVGVSVAVYAFLATTIWMPRLVYLGLSVCAAMAMYLVLLKVCKIEELNFLKALVKR